ncbi:MAG: hypothetical protein WBC75_09355, partial [Dehalococcoidales bacterium]
VIAMGKNKHIKNDVFVSQRDWAFNSRESQCLSGKKIKALQRKKKNRAKKPIGGWLDSPEMKIVREERKRI